MIVHFNLSWMSSVKVCRTRAPLLMRKPTHPLLLEAFHWLLNITIVFLATRYLFSMNNRGIFYGYDSQSFRTLLGASYRLSNVLFGLGIDFVNGLGNVSSVPNPHWFPSVLLASAPSGNIEDGPLAYAIAATELFAATLLCGRALALKLSVSIAAGWLITLATWPLFVSPKIVTLWVFTPTHAEILSVSVLVTTAALCMRARPIWRPILLTAIAFFGLTHVVLGDPTSLTLVGPVVAISAGVSFLLSSNQSERLTIFLCWAVIAVACFVLGYFHYLWGLLAYTATNFYPDIFTRPHTLFEGETTLLLWVPVYEFTMASFGNLTSLFSPERLFVGGGIVGGIALLWVGSPNQRRLALSVLIAEAVFLCAGFTNYFWPFWFGPQIRYYELMLFPYFALCICFIVFLPANLVWRVGRNWFSNRAFLWVPQIADGAVAIMLSASIGLYATTIGENIREQAKQDVAYALASPFPQPETSITHILKAEAKLIPGEPFRGRVAVMTGLSPEVRNHGMAGLIHHFSQLATGNFHDGPGLWQDDIPTWLEYNRLMSPARFVLQRCYAVPLLRAAGVRFVITDLPIPWDIPRLTSGEAKHRAELTIPTPSSAQQLLLSSSSHSTFESFRLHLYELNNPNLGQFSPVEVKEAEDARSLFNTLCLSLSDPDHTVFGAVESAGPLRKASLESFTIARDGYKVRARSDGSSILLLPIEFSRCLRVVSGLNGPAPRLFRADLALTGVLFERRLNADISFRTGPGDASGCRLQDASDAERMKLRNAR
jgi:hypothetical protein